VGRQRFGSEVSARNHVVTFCSSKLNHGNSSHSDDIALPLIVYLHDGAGVWGSPEVLWFCVAVLVAVVVVKRCFVLCCYHEVNVQSGRTGFCTQSP
jgi:hypothetical protein